MTEQEINEMVEMNKTLTIENETLKKEKEDFKKLSEESGKQLTEARADSDKLKQELAEANELIKVKKEADKVERKGWILNGKY